MTEPEFTYDAHKRRGWCGCGRWQTYGVSRAEFDQAARRHRAWHVRQNQLFGDPVPEPPADLGVFADALKAIEALPTTEER